MRWDLPFPDAGIHETAGGQRASQERYHHDRGHRVQRQEQVQVEPVIVPAHDENVSSQQHRTDGRGDPRHLVDELFFRHRAPCISGPTR